MTLEKPLELIKKAVPWTIEIVFLCGHGPSNVVYVHTHMVRISINCYLVTTMWTFNKIGYKKIKGCDIFKRFGLPILW